MTIDNCCQCNLGFVIQNLKQYRAWPGVSAYTFLPAFFGATPPNPWVGFWLPSVAWRQNYRRRWVSVHEDYRRHNSPCNDGSVDWSSSGTLSGAGHAPQLTVPSQIFQCLKAGGPTDRQFYTLQSAELNRNVQPQQDGASYTGYSFDVPDDTLTYALANEAIFNIWCSQEAFDRVNARAFDQPLDPQASPLFEEELKYEFGMVNAGDPVNPADYDGHWQLSPGLIDANPPPPWFGQPGPDSTAPHYSWDSLGMRRWLWSGWYYPTAEEFDNFYSADPNGSSSNIPSNPGFPVFVVQRARCKVPISTHYFIAMAYMTRPPVPGLGPVPSSDDVARVRLQSEGTLASGATLEVPFPGIVFFDSYLDFAAVSLERRGTDTWTCGAMCFAVLGETSAQWSARTGVQFLRGP